MAPTRVGVPINGDEVTVPDGAYLRDAAFSREGANLILAGPDGTVVMEGYFAAGQPPLITAPDGSALTPTLLRSFLSNDAQYAQTVTSHDVSPVGTVAEVVGQATVTRVDGGTEAISIGVSIYEGDIVETATDGAVNIIFMDETSFAIAENARLAIDEYVFDLHENSGSTNFSVLKGIFVFTSGLIGRTDPDDVQIDTPMGSIGIRGTTIAGNVTTGEITVIEGAIVLRNHSGQEVTLADQFETAKFNPAVGTIDILGVLSSEAVSTGFASLSAVSGPLFSSFGEFKGESQDSSPPDTTPREDRQPTENDKQESSGEEHGQLEKQQSSRVGMDTKQALDIQNADSAQHLTDELHAKLTGTVGVELTQNRPATALDTHEDAGLRQPSASTRPESPALHYAPSAQPQPLNRAPVHGRDMPSEYFALIKEPGRTFAYNFSQEFVDPEGNQLLFSLGNNGLNIDGVTVNLDSVTGLLTLTLGADLATSPNELSLQIMASDGVNQTAATPITFRFLESDGDLQLGPPLGNGNYNDATAQVLRESGHSQIGNNGANKTVFLNSSESSTFDVLGGNNVVYVGENPHHRTVSLGEQATGNTIFGGSQNETVHVKDEGNAIYTGGGDDTVVLHLDKLDASETGRLKVDIDFGEEHADLIAWANAFLQGGQERITELAADGKGSFGDTLTLMGAGQSLDFSNIDKLRGMETLDLRSDGGAQTVFLTVEDIFSATGNLRTLLIRGDESDTVYIDTQGGDATLLQQGILIEGETYDAYTAQNSAGYTVTVLIDADIGNVSGL